MDKSEKDLQIKALSDKLTDKECNLLDLENKNKELILKIEFLKNNKRKNDCLQLSVLNCEYIDPNTFFVQVPLDFDLNKMETIVQSFIPNAKICVCNLEERKNIFHKVFFFLWNFIYSFSKKKNLEHDDDDLQHALKPELQHDEDLQHYDFDYQKQVFKEILDSEISLNKEISEPEAHNSETSLTKEDDKNIPEPKAYSSEISLNIPEPEAYNSHHYENCETTPNIKDCWHNMLNSTLSKNQEKKLWLIVFALSDSFSEQKCTIVKGEKTIDMACQYLEKFLPFIKIINIYEFYDTIEDKVSMEMLLKSLIFENPLFEPEYFLCYVKLIRKVVAEMDSIHPLCEKFLETNCIFDQDGSSLYDLYNSFVSCYNYFIEPERFIKNIIMLNVPFSTMEKNKVYIKVVNMKNEYLAADFDKPRIPNRQLRSEPRIIPFQISPWFNSSLSKSM